MTDLSRVPVSELLSEALARPHEMIDERGFLSDEAFRLADLLGIRYCVDGIPVKINDDNEIEAMAIRRNTGPNKDRWTAIGGGVARVMSDTGEWLPESMEEALQRHFKTDLGVEIELITDTMHPQLIIEQMRAVDGALRPGFEDNPTTRHCVASRYLVKLVADPDFSPIFGSTQVGGQEASGIKWFTEPDIPPNEDFGYMHDATYREMFGHARALLLGSANSRF
jgi:ADP-ribose pyrophosphatase YjhB (NUDIX family)